MTQEPRHGEADIIGGFQYADSYCRGCGKLLTVENAWMTDGCPCNSVLGINSMNETRWRLLMQLQQQQAHAHQQALREAQEEIRNFMDVANQNAAERNEAWEKAKELEDELENERIRHAACGVIALANTRESAKEARQIKPEYWSASCQDVAKAVDREMEQREQLAAQRTAMSGLVEALKGLRFGNCFCGFGIGDFRADGHSEACQQANAALAAAEAAGVIKN